jgi:hypothetical protein
MIVAIILFIIPLITGLIAAFFKLKEEGSPLWKKITFAGGVVGLLSIVFFLLGIYDLTDKSNKEEKYQSTLDSVNNRYEIIKKDFAYLKGTNDAYYTLLQTLGYKLDSTKSDAKINADSLVAVIRSQETNVDNSVARFLLCPDTNNLQLTHQPNDTTKVEISFCTTTKPVNKFQIRVESLSSSPMKTVPRLYNYLMNSSSVVPPYTAVRNELFFPSYHFDKTVYLFFSVSYYDDENKIHHSKQLVRAKPGGKRFSMASDENTEEVTQIINFLKQQKLY